MSLLEKAKLKDPRTNPEDWTEDELHELHNQIYSSATGQFNAITDAWHDSVNELYANILLAQEKERKENQKRKPAKTHRYLITFTLKPDAVNKSKEAEDYVVSQAKRQNALGINQMHYVVEKTKQGVPHFHVVLETDTPLKKNRFQYYEKLFGHVDISKTKGTTIDEGLNYISKESKPIKLV